MTSMTDQISMFSGVIRPRITLKSGGVSLPSPQRLEIHRSRMAEISMFTAVIPVEGLTAQWFDPTDTSTNEIDIEIFCGFLDSGSAEGTESFSRIFSGLVDYIEYHPETQVVVASGRDWACRLIEYELSETSFLNMSASDALGTLAEEVGLETDIDSTDGLVGQFYQYEHKARGVPGMHRYQTGWDFCVGMQREYGYDLWADDKTLHFRAPDISSSPLTLDWTAASSASSCPAGPVNNLTLARRFTYPRNASVTVSSWDARQRCIHSATYPSDENTTSAGYNFTAAVGTTQDQCLKLAKLRFNDLTAHERMLRMSVHPELDISPRQRIRLQGTGTTFDSVIYTVDEVFFLYDSRGISKNITLRVRGGTEDLS